MASLLEEIADALARDVIRAARELGDDDLVTEISRVIGASSTTTQEAFMTAVRVRTAEGRARQVLAERLGPRYSEEPAWTSTAPVRRPGPCFAEPPPVMAPVAPIPASAAPTAPTAEQPRDMGPAAPETKVVAKAPEVTPPPVKVPDEAPVAAPSEPAEAAPAEKSPAGLVRPRMAASLERPVAAPAVMPTVTPSTDTLAAALALAASLPRRAPTPSEPKPPVQSPYSDIEIPDGDWG